MGLLISIFVILGITWLISYIRSSIKAVKREKHDEKLRMIRILRDKYPDAYKEWFGVDFYLVDMSDEELNRRLSKTSFEWQSKQQSIIEQREREHKRIQEIEVKYNALIAKYPDGVSLVKKLREADKSIDEIYTFVDRMMKCRGFRVRNSDDNIVNIPEDVFKKYDAISKESSFMRSWKEKQEKFSKRIPSLCNSAAPDFGYYTYTINIGGVGETGETKMYRFTIWQSFYSAHCLSKSIDYGEYTYLRNNADEVIQLVNRKRYFNQSGYDQILALIDAIREKCVVAIADSRLGDSWDAIEDYHFSYLKRELESREILCISIKQIDCIKQYESPIIVIIELISNNERLKQTCQYVFEECKAVKPRIVFVSLRKEYSESEIVKLVENKKRKEAEEAERIARLERERLYNISHTKKSNAEAFKKYLSDNGIRYFYHFTDRRNLQSIKECGGLYSWKYCEEHDISIPYPGGDSTSRSLDSRHGLSDYVRLSFCNDHPMKWVLEQKGYNMVLLQVSIEVACLEGTLFSDINATDNTHRHGGNFEDLQMINIAATKQNYVSKTSPIFKQHQAEVMVKTFIPLEYIKMPQISPEDDGLPF